MPSISVKISSEENLTIRRFLGSSKQTGKDCTYQRTGHIEIHQ